VPNRRQRLKPGHQLWSGRRRRPASRRWRRRIRRTRASVKPVDFILKSQRAWRHRGKAFPRSSFIPPMPKPLSLSDDESETVMAAAAPVHPHQRDDFLRALAGELERFPVIGPELCIGARRSCSTNLSSRRERRPRPPARRTTAEPLAESPAISSSPGAYERRAKAGCPAYIRQAMASKSHKSVAELVCGHDETAPKKASPNGVTVTTPKSPYARTGSPEAV
jgi:hypothetical protein